MSASSIIVSPFTPALLAAALPSGKLAVFEKFAPQLGPAFARFDITTPLRQAHFLAQVTHESADFQILRENLNYSATALMNTWPSRFTSALAKSYERQPERIANFVYANRMGNGDEASGDGFRYRGHGPIQITGKDMYQKIEAAIGLPVTANPELLCEPEAGLLASAWFWTVEKRLNELADADDVKAITRRINGGLIGLDDRTKRLTQLKAKLGL